MTKLIHLGVRGWLISWICSFLSGRRQAVKLLDSISEWMPVHAGVPQGTKLGPILFLIMINDLATHSPLRSSHWKYVDDDDVTISEVSSLGEVSSLQNDIDCISQWAQQNNMNLNPKKCKIMTIRPLKNKPVSPMLSINNLPLEAVLSYKVLGLTLCDTLKWTIILTTSSPKRPSDCTFLGSWSALGSLRRTMSPSIAPWFALS